MATVAPVKQTTGVTLTLTTEEAQAVRRFLDSDNPEAAKFRKAHTAWIYDLICDLAEFAA